jgi:hypothetical protein
MAHRMAPYPAAGSRPRHVDGSSELSAEEVFAALAEARPEDAVLVEESPSNLPRLYKG